MFFSYQPLTKGFWHTPMDKQGCKTVKLFAYNSLVWAAQEIICMKNNVRTLYGNILPVALSMPIMVKNKRKQEGTTWKSKSGCQIK